MCGLGQSGYFRDMLRSYWGGMLSFGATTFWEHYDPSLSRVDNLRMYGNSYGKSLCHAWSASPIYLLGKYVLGVTPDTPGFKTYSVRPDTLGLERFDGAVPVPGGLVRVSLKNGRISVLSDIPGGTLYYGGKEYEIKQGIGITV